MITDLMLWRRTGWFLWNESQLRRSLNRLECNMGGTCAFGNFALKTNFL